MNRIVSFLSRLFKSYSASVTISSILMGAWPPLTICYILLDARLHLNFPDDLNTILYVILSTALFCMFIGGIGAGAFRRLGLKPWLKDFRVLNAVVRGNNVLTEDEYIDQVYAPLARKHNKKRRNRENQLTPVEKLSPAQRGALYREALKKALPVIINFPRKYSIVTLSLAFFLIMAPGAIFTSVMTQNYGMVIPIILIGVGFFITFLFISFELNTAPVRARLKELLKPATEEFRFSLRFKFIMQLITLILSVVALFTMMVDKKLDLNSSIQFIFLVGLITVFLTYLYIRSILMTLSEVAVAVNDLGQGGQGTLILSSLDREFVELGNDFKKAAEEVVQHRQNLEVKVRQKTSELEQANEVLLEKDKIVQMELDLASDIQGGLYPHTREWKDLRFGYFYRPMEKVSGDFFDIFEMEGERLGVLVADVSGHGVPAALITTMAKLSFEAKSQEHSSPGRILDMVNRDLQAHVKTQDYMTAFFLVFDPDYSFKYSNASHQKILHLRTDGSVEELDAHGIFLGADELLFDPNVDEHYEVKQSKIEKGDRIILFTDGIPEMRSAKGEEFGNERMIQFVQENKNMDIERLRESFHSYFFNFIDEEQISDDITFMIVERL